MNEKPAAGHLARTYGGQPKEVPMPSITEKRPTPTPLVRHSLVEHFRRTGRLDELRAAVETYRDAPTTWDERGWHPYTYGWGLLMMSGFGF